MKVVITQPTYLPWIGYFDLIAQADVFIVLDDVQFEKQSWQQRNRIKTAAGLHWLTVPVKFRGRLNQLIREVEIREPGFWRDHVRAIELAYRRATSFENYFPVVSDILQRLSDGKLLDLNISLLRWLLEEFNIKTPMLSASSLGLTGKRTEHLANLCQAVGAKEYLSPLGASAYLLHEGDLLLQRGIEVRFQNYQHPVYRQLFGEFQPYASTLDLLFNEGHSAIEIIRGGRRPLYSMEDLAAFSQGPVIQA